MSDNGSGVYVVNSAGQPVVSATPITAVAFNAYTADAATAMSNRICKDGQSTPTANIPLGGYKLTGVGAATARTDAATIATIQDGTGVYVATVGGTATAITLTPSPAIAAYVAGQKFSFIVAATNASISGATVAISGLTAKNLNNGTNSLVGGELRIGDLITILYDGSEFQVLNHRKSLEGFTPVLTAGTPGNLSVSYTEQLGYIEISGNKITAWFSIITSAYTHTTASGNILVTGLPFRASTLMSPFFGGGVNFSGFTKANYTQIVSAVAGNATQLTFYGSGSGQANTVLAITDFPTGGTVKLQGCITYTHDGG